MLIANAPATTTVATALATFRTFVMSKTLPDSLPRLGFAVSAEG
ncbi:hypothetical protein I546_2655 [Mycobacterium kansasii 732]|nr:hypothetical protein I546_2655 [Mycobacterium kansasii 732]